MIRFAGMVSALFIVTLVAGSADGAYPKGAYYYGGSEFVEVVAQDFGTIVSIKQYSRTIEHPPSERFVIRSQMYYLDLDANGTGLLRESPTGRPCGIWSVSRTADILTLTREGTKPLTPGAPVTKGNYFGRPYHLTRHDASAESAYINGLREQSRWASVWVSAGHKVSEAERDRYAYYGSLFKC